MKRILKVICIFIACITVFSLIVSCFSSKYSGLTNSSSSSSIQNEKENIDFSGKTYIALGDSITYGASSLHPEQYANGGYPQCVKNELGLRYAINYGDNGRPILRFPSVVSDMPSADIVSVMGGVNDWGISNPMGSIEDYNITTFYGALNILCDSLKAKYENSFIFFMTPYKTTACTNPNNLNYVLLDYVNAIKQVCAKWNIPVLDMYSNGNIEIIFNDKNFDGVHPTEEFFENYTAPQIAEFIRENYKA